MAAIVRQGVINLADSDSDSDTEGQKYKTAGANRPTEPHPGPSLGAQPLAGYAASLCFSTGDSFWETVGVLSLESSDLDIAEMQALLEGLRAAADHGIKHLAIKLSSRTLLRSFHGKAAASSDDAAALLQQQPHPTDLDPSEPQPQVNEATVDCPICLESQPQSRMHPIQGCLHSYCRECLEGHISSKVEDRVFPIPCPTPKCEAHISLEEVGVLVEAYATIKILLKLEMEAAIPESIKFYCPRPQCSHLMVLENARPDEQAECQKCRQNLCLWCKTVGHPGKTCGENKSGESHDDKLLELAQKNKWRQCPKCRSMVARSSGCDHMQCRCGARFCYGCGKDAERAKVATALAKPPDLHR
ncbi:hypothetical protein WJX73_006269 [Symbiochloris irregularis]|uniref:RBR-type E3 ubiquitin transferase n=1 Tax=Symbiochloris irregularis TaxID=706552 RepID=A0AAW1PZ76_9CHLO